MNFNINLIKNLEGPHGLEAEDSLYLHTFLSSGYLFFIHFYHIKGREQCFSEMLKQEHYMSFKNNLQLVFPSCNHLGIGHLKKDHPFVRSRLQCYYRNIIDYTVCNYLWSTLHTYFSVWVVVRTAKSAMAKNPITSHSDMDNVS